MQPDPLAPFFVHSPTVGAFIPSGWLRCRESTLAQRRILKVRVIIVFAAAKCTATRTQTNFSLVNVYLELFFFHFFFGRHGGPYCAARKT